MLTIYFILSSIKWRRKKLRTRKWESLRLMLTIGQLNVNKPYILFYKILLKISYSVKLGRKHPDPVVETASLSSVEPSDITYKLSIPQECIDRGFLSALQLEAITYTCQAHEHMLQDGSRAGFLVGDILFALGPKAHV